MAEVSEQKSKIKAPSMIDALIPVGFLVILLAAAVYLYGGDATGGPFQIALILSAIVAGLVSRKNGHSFEKIGRPLSMASPRPWAPSSFCWRSGP